MGSKSHTTPSLGLCPSSLQLLLLDSNSHQVIAEYGNELEALVAQELLSPVAGTGARVRVYGRR